MASLAVALVAASVLVADGATARTASATLVVDNSFTIKTSDPGRAFDPTASLVDHALYDTLFTYKGGDLAHPIPLLVSSFKATSNAKTYTFQLKRNVHFADGTKRGWVRNTLDASAWEAEYRAVDDITSAGSSISVPARFRIVPTTPGAQRIP